LVIDQSCRLIVDHASKLESRLKNGLTKAFKYLFQRLVVKRHGHKSEPTPIVASFQFFILLPAVNRKPDLNQLATCDASKKLIFDEIIENE